MLDRLTPLWRHLALLVIAAGLSWAGTDLVPWLSAHPGWGPAAGALTTALLAIVTPLTRQYGYGADGEPPEDDGTSTVRVVVRCSLVAVAVLLLAALVASTVPRPADAAVCPARGMLALAA